MSEPCYPSKCCVDCLFLIANGETDPNWTQEETEDFLKRFNKATEGYEVTLGKGRKYHDCLDDNGETANDRGDDCECEEEGFYWSACDVCGSNLGGDRFAVTFWIPEVES